MLQDNTHNDEHKQGIGNYGKAAVPPQVSLVSSAQPHKDRTRYIFQNVAARDNDILGAIRQLQIDEILTGMREYSDSISVQQVSIQALLSHLSCDSDSSSKLSTLLVHQDTQGCLGFLEADGISILSSIMQQHSYSPKIQEHACWVIDALVRANRDYVPLLLQDNCIEAMIHSLRTHASVDSLVDWVLKATHAMMLVSTQVHEAFRIARGTQLLVAVLDSHHNHAEILETCLSIMSFLVNHDAQNGREFTKVILQNGQNLTSILDVILSRKATPEQVLIQAVQLLYVLNRSIDAYREKHGLQFIKPVIQCMSNFETTTEMMLSANRFLHVIMISSTEQKDAIINAGGIPSIIRGMKSCISNEQVVTAALLCLLSLSVRPAHRKKLLDCGCVKLIVQVLDIFQGASQVELYACWIFENISLDIHGQQAIVKEGKLVDTYQAKSDSVSRDIFSKALGLLRRYQEGENTTPAFTLETCQGCFIL
eukprot:gene10720-2811_t